MMDPRDVERTIEELRRRVRSLEMTAQRGALPRVAQRSPEGSFVWHDVEGGKLRVWNGKSWDTWSKD